MTNKENIIITNVESTEIIQQYVVREIKKVLDKYKNIDKEEIRSVEKLINNISNEELKEEFLNDWSKSANEYWIEQTSKEEVIDDLIRGSNSEELLGLIPETIYEDEYEMYLYSEIDC